MADHDPEPVQHLHAAVDKKWAFRQAPILDREVEDLIRQIVHEPDNLMKKRAAALQYWTARAQQLDKERTSMLESLPDHLQSTTGRLHVPLLKELLEAADHHDQDLIEHLTHGFPVIGEMTAGGQGKAAPGGVLRAGKQAHGRVPDLQSFRQRCRRINEATIARAQPGPHAEELWRKTVQEIHKGHICNIRTLDDVDLDSILLTERFGVEQVNTEGIIKVRPIDNYRSNHANDQTVAWETVTNDREDILTETVLRLQEDLEESRQEDHVLVGLEDYVSAYRTLPPAEAQRWLMHLLVWDTDCSEWKVCELMAMPFGAIGGVLAWWRIARALRTIARNIFHLLVFYYVDDTHLIERAQTAEQGKVIFQTLMKTLGWSLDQNKSTPMSTKVISLGCHLKITRGGVQWSLTDAKREKWMSDILSALQADQLSSTEASKLHGRLSFGVQRIFGRVGRAALRPICHRQLQPRALKLSNHLRGALIWWLRYLESWPCALTTAPARRQQTCDYILYTDAEGSGGMGAVLINTRTWETTFTMGCVPKHLDARLRARKTQINLYELLAIWASAITFIKQISQSSTVIFIDNQSALNMVIKGWSPCEDANMILHELWLLLARRGVSTHFEYVQSKANLADGPSRGCTQLLHPLQAERTEFVWPEWPQRPSDWLLGPGCPENRT